MSELDAKLPTQRRSGLVAVALAGLVAVAAGIYLIAGADRKTEAPAPSAEEPAVAGKVTRALATGTLTAFVVKPGRPAAPDLQFTDSGGKPRSLGEWRGRVVLVNLWATWCGPCRKEMPSLAALERQLGSKDFDVLAISLDRKGAEAAAPFLTEVGASDLALYLDPSTSSLKLLEAAGLPASVLIDRQGREIGRMLGPADWSAPEALALVRAAIAEKAEAS